jgi:hypothetical protein
VVLLCRGIITIKLKDFRDRATIGTSTSIQCLIKINQMVLNLHQDRVWAAEVKLMEATMLTYHQTGKIIVLYNKDRVKTTTRIPTLVVVRASKVKPIVVVVTSNKSWSNRSSHQMFNKLWSKCKHRSLQLKIPVQSFSATYRSSSNKSIVHRSTRLVRQLTSTSLKRLLKVWAKTSR